MEKITIKDIARKADVSPGTVSKIITGKYKEDKVQISQSTVERVQKIIKEVNYQPNYGARLLSTGKTYTIGIYIPKTKKQNFTLGHYYSGLINSIEKEAVQHQYDILLINYDSFITKFDTKRIDGLIIIEQTEVNDQLRYLVTEQRPFVVINNLVDEKIEMCSINLDNYEGVKGVVNCFKEHKHKKLAFIGELIFKPQKEHLIRLKHFKDLMKKADMMLNEDLFLIDGVTGITENIHEMYYDQLSGYYGMKYLTEKYKGKYTGVFCANDIIALGALDYLYEAGIKVPDQVSVIGFDDVDFAAHLMGGLTTVKQPVDKIGKEAFTQLLKIINSDEPMSAQNIKIKPQMEIRGTVARI